MRKFQWAVGAIAVLFTALNLGRAADDEAVDLRGPAPQKGQVVVSKGTLKIKDADTTVEVDAAALNKLLGNSFADVKGKLKQKFVKIEEIDGEKVAVVESSGKITGKMKYDGMPTVDAELDLKLTTWKSLKTGVAVKEKFEGKIKLAGKVKMDEIEAEMTLSGPISGDSTTKLK